MAQDQDLSLRPFALPYTKIPEGFGYPANSISAISNTDAFGDAINERDGERCVVCGLDTCLAHVHIIPRTEKRLWKELKKKKWIPKRAKSVAHEARNGILLCPNHRWAFDHLCFYIRFYPQSQKFILVNHSRLRDWEMFHGKPLCLLNTDHHVPFQSIFLVHEARVRGHHPFEGDRSIPGPITDQDWVLAPRIVSPPSSEEQESQEDGSPAQVGNSFNQQDGTGLRYGVGQVEGPGWIRFTNPFADRTKLNDLVQSFQAQPSWKASVVEGGGWDGTAEENVARYLSSVKVDPSP